MSNKNQNWNRNKNKDNTKPQSDEVRDQSTEETPSKPTNLGKKGSSNRDKARNHSKWYAANEAVLRDVASLPFANAIGTELDFNVGFKAAHEFVNVPGIAAMRLMPAIGNTKNPEDPFNIAMQNFQVKLTTTVSGQTSFEAPDSTMYLISVAHAYSYLVFLQRLYAYARTYTAKNRYFPKAVIEAQGVDFASIVNNLNDFRSGMDVLLSKLASFPIPKDMYYVDRLIYEYAQVYTEGESVKDQVYLMYPDGFYIYDREVDPGTGLKTGPGMLAYTKLNTGTPLTYTDLLNYGNTMFAALTYDSEIQKIAAFVLRAFGGDIVSMSHVAPDIVGFPIYDENFLWQFHNATVCLEADLTIPDVKHDATKQWLVAQYKYENVSSQTLSLREGILSLTGDRLLTIPRANVTPEDVIEATRLMVTAEYHAGDDEVVLNPMLEIPVSVTLHRLVNGVLTGVDIAYPYAYFGDDVAQVDSVLLMSQMYACYMYLPCVFLLRYDTSASTTVDRGSLVIQLDNYQQVNNQTIKQMHEASILSMLSVLIIESFKQVKPRYGR